MRNKTISRWTAILLLVVAPVYAAEQGQYLRDHDCEEKTVVLPHSDLTVHFTADGNVPRSEPPIQECKFGIELTDKDGKVVSNWGPIVLSAPPIRDVQQVHGRQIIVIGAKSFFLVSVGAGRITDIAFWQAERFDYFPLANGDLQLVVYRAYEQYDELPNVFRFDGFTADPDEQGRNAVLERIAKDSLSIVQATDQVAPKDWVEGLRLMTKLRKACVRVLRAEAVLGDAASAIQACRTAREKIEALSAKSCGSNSPNCVGGLRDTEIALIESAMKEVNESEPYRRRVVQPTSQN